jgi:hypothetical protein
MGAIVGDIITPVLILIHIIWDKKHGDFRGLWLHILGAVCVGWDSNLLLNVNTAPMNPWSIILCVAFFAVLFYVLAGLRRSK